MANIKRVIAREILGSRGFPTVEAIIELEDSSVGTFAVPSGISVGKHEAVELRDGDVKRYAGKGVLKALLNIHTKLAPQIIGKDAANQKLIDKIMIEADNSPNKSTLGANSILALSAGVVKAQANSQNLSVYQYIAKLLDQDQQPYFSIPTPMFNILN